MREIPTWYFEDWMEIDATAEATNEPKKFGSKINSRNDSVIPITVALR